MEDIIVYENGLIVIEDEGSTPDVGLFCVKSIFGDEVTVTKDTLASMTEVLLTNKCTRETSVEMTEDKVFKLFAATNDGKRTLLIPKDAVLAMVNYILE